jgi:hypothetical protein
VTVQRHHSSDLLVPATTAVKHPIWYVIVHKPITTIVVMVATAVVIVTVVVTVPVITAVLLTTSAVIVAKAHDAITARNMATCPKIVHRISKME